MPQQINGLFNLLYDSALLMTLSLDKQNEYRRRYAALQDNWQPATERYETRIRRYLQDDMRVLDMGCGRGGVFEQLQDAVTYPIGIDPDLVSLQEHRLVELPRTCATSDNLPFQTEQFDLVLCSWVLEHLAQPQKTFAEVARILKPGGYFIFMTPNKNSVVVGLNRLVKPLQKWLVPLLYGREETDTFPVVYRANTSKQLTQIAQEVKLHQVRLDQIFDPTYLAFHPILFDLNVKLTRLLPSSMAEHLVGVYQK